MPQADSTRRALMAQLVKLRQTMGLTQQDVAERMGATQAVVSRLGTCRCDSRLGTLQRYARALNAHLQVEAEPLPVSP
jgi:predicted transcriptional regulator